MTLTAVGAAYPEIEGVVVERRPNQRYVVEVRDGRDRGGRILARPAGKLRMQYVRRIGCGTRVRVELDGGVVFPDDGSDPSEVDLTKLNDCRIVAVLPP